MNTVVVAVAVVAVVIASICSLLHYIARVTDFLLWRSSAHWEDTQRGCSWDIFPLVKEEKKTGRK